MEKINVAELLKDCPKGMELDCTICNNVVTLEAVDTEEYYPIRVVSKAGFHHALTREGCVYEEGDAKCVIFPKGKTTWEGFQRPFKDGDIAASKNGSFIGIVKYADENCIYTYCAINAMGNLTKNFPYYLHRFATEEEKQRLFDAIKANGYKWNDEAKTLEKLIEPRFKVWDKIRLKNDRTTIETINYIYSDSYGLCSNHLLFFKEQDKYELAPDKFDINTLVHFESRVLVRGDKSSYWKPAIFGCYIENLTIPYYALGGTCWHQCIPFEGNEHLLGTTDDCDEYFKTWK